MMAYNNLQRYVKSENNPIFLDELNTILA